MIPQKGCVKVNVKTEDATKGDGYVYVTEEKLTNGKSTKTTKKYKTKNYYKTNNSAGCVHIGGRPCSSIIFFKSASIEAKA